MRWLLSLIFVIVTLSSATAATETKTEYIEEKVCSAVAGCWINPKTGECPDCVTETRKVVTIIETEDEPILKEKENITIAAIKFPTKENSKRECIVGVCAWLYEKD